jgi:DNA-binding MarR family transcriptional regulator
VVDELLSEVDTLEASLSSLSRVLVGLTARTLASLDVDLTLSQHRIIVLLASLGPQRTVDLAAAIGVHPSTVTRACNRLVRRGLVDRRHRAQDRRVSWLMLTDQGRELVGELVRLRSGQIRELVTATLPQPRPPTTVELIDALVTAAGEPSEERWWKRWAESTAPPR